MLFISQARLSMAVLVYVSIRDMAGWARVWSLQLPVWMKVGVVGKC